MKTALFITLMVIFTLFAILGWILAIVETEKKSKLADKLRDLGEW